MSLSHDTSVQIKECHPVGIVAATTRNLLELDSLNRKLTGATFPWHCAAAIDNAIAIDTEILSIVQLVPNTHS